MPLTSPESLLKTIAEQQAEIIALKKLVAHLVYANDGNLQNASLSRDGYDEQGFGKAGEFSISNRFN